MNTVPVKSIQYPDNNKQRFRVCDVHSKYPFHAWHQRTKPEDFNYLIQNISAIIGGIHWGRIRSAIAYRSGEQGRFKFSPSKVRIQSNEAELAELTALEDKLLTKKIDGSLNRLDEVILDSIQEQIDELIGVQNPTEAEQGFLNKFDQLLDQSRELLGKLDALMPDHEGAQ